MSGSLSVGPSSDDYQKPLFFRYWPIFLSLLGVLTAYILILPNNLSSLPYAGDGGDFVTAVLTHGIPHPSGYPLYILISEVLMLVGRARPVWTMALISSFSTVILLGILAVVLNTILQHTRERVWIIALVLLTLGLSTLIWSQAVIVEVYTLSYISIAIYLLWELRVPSQPKDNTAITQWTVLSWVGGLFLGAHLTFIFLLPPVLFRLYKLYRTGIITIPRCLLIGAGWCSGILLYLWIPYRAAQAPAINWGNAVDLSGLWWLISGGGYAPLVFSIQPMEYIGRLSSLLRLSLGDFTIPGIFLLVYSATKKRAKFSLLPQCLYIMAVYSVFAIGYRTNDSFAYLLPVWIAAGVLLAIALQDISQINFLKLRIFPWIMVGILLLVLSQAPARLSKVDPRDYTVAVEAQEMLTLAASNSTLYAEGDAQTFALWYYRYGLGLRDDVEIVSQGLLQFDWYRKQIGQ